MEETVRLIGELGGIHRQGLVQNHAQVARQDRSLPRRLVGRKAAQVQIRRRALVVAAIRGGEEAPDGAARGRAAELVRRQDPGRLQRRRGGGARGPRGTRGLRVTSARR